MEKMLRGILLSLVIALSLNAVCSKAGVTKNLTALHEDESVSIETHVRESREIGSILSSIKQQFREIIEDVINGIWNSIKLFSTQLRDRLLRQMESYTFSDVLRSVINAIFEASLGPEVVIETVVEPEPVELDVVEPIEMVYRHPYPLRSLYKGH